MRKVTEEAAQALLAAKQMKSVNTEVRYGNGLTEVRMYLHGNCIASFDYDTKVLWLGDCGWQTVTTKERLNGILSVFGMPYSIFQQNGKWILATYNTDGAARNELWQGQKTFNTQEEEIA